jgi:hypothetical protein
MIGTQERFLLRPYKPPGESTVLDLDEAFFALEQLDGEGRKALVLCGQIWEETYRSAVLRAEKAEWLQQRVHQWASGWGLTFDTSKAAAHWEAEHDRPVPVLGIHLQALLSQRREEIDELRKRLDEALDGREQAEIRADQAERALLHLRHKGRKS